ncbi:AMP-binding protein [Microterricola viridarii]|uniref:AMP-dependent synthetase n=1 Tax=Microterricola viridarii TaxID=412690 RepID=A0A0X8E3D2_9MICO|nr:AMP-binding protein [Microterricola viridarii]AMB59716.1 AMP-dependent synthetase [Microterricola viridarii]
MAATDSTREHPGTTALRAARDQLLELRSDGAAARAEFRWPDVGPDFNWAQHWFDALAAGPDGTGNDGTALWIVEEDGSEARYSFAELRERSDRLANWLRAEGVRPGDAVMLMLGNRVELWDSMLAVLKLGAVILPSSVVLGPADLTDRVERAAVRFVIADPTDAAKFADVPGDYRGICVGAGVTGGPAAAPAGWLDMADAAGSPASAIQNTVGSGDPALIYFTSGTTSLPKMVVHSHLSYPVGHLSTMYWLGVQPGDVHMAISSAGWGKHAWSSFFAPWIAGATVFVYNYARFDAAALVAQLDRAGVMTFCAPPTVWRMLIQSEVRQKPHALRELLSAGEPLNPEVIGRIRDWWGLEIRDGYGQTETTALIGNTPGTPLVPGAMGHPLPGVSIALVDPLTGKPSETNEGEICLDLASRPLNLMTGYLGDPERTRSAMRGGFFHTGDVASRAADGTLTFIGRTDDIFKSSDFKVSPFEVESVLIEHPAVAEAAVVGAPDATRLNITKAYIALAAGALPDEATALAVLAHARAALPPYMRVRRIEFFELPKTASGKIRRVELRQREVDAAAAGLRAPGEWREEDFPGLKRG